MPDIAFLNGKWLPVSEAYVNIEDRGFQFGDSLYEVARMYNGVPFKAKEHMERMFRGFSFIELEPPHSLDEFVEIMNEAAKRSGYTDQAAFVYVQVTRGMAGARNHVITPGYKPTVVMTVRSISEMKEEDRIKGFKAITHPDWRWDKCFVKATTLLPNVLVRTKAVRLGCYDAVQYRDQYITEGTVSNFWALINGTLRTHPKTDEILWGISRDVVFEIAKKIGLPIDERAIRVDEVYKASECFFSDTYGEVTPIVEIDGQKIGDGSTETCIKLWRAFREVVDRETKR